MKSGRIIKSKAGSGIRDISIEMGKRNVNLLKSRRSVMFNFIFLIVWVIYGIFEVVIIRNNNAKRPKLHVIAMILWIVIGILVCYQFFIAN